MFKHRFFILSIIILIFSFSIVHADAYVTYNFYDEQNNPVKGVDVRGYTCNGYDCNTVNTIYWNWSSNTGNSDRVTMKFPTNLPSSGTYGIYFFKNGYIFKKYLVNWGGTGTVGPYGRKFKKSPNSCDAPVTLSIANKSGEWLPLTISTDTELGTAASSDFSYNDIIPYYYPINEFPQHVEVDTTITVTITDTKTNAVVYK